MDYKSRSHSLSTRDAVFQLRPASQLYMSLLGMGWTQEKPIFVTKTDSRLSFYLSNRRIIDQQEDVNASETKCGNATLSESTQPTVIQRGSSVLLAVRLQGFCFFEKGGPL